ncbi:phospholemman-like isoform X2 [Lepisosteus oculatus]|uniref:phospholemman-like isoform X2 n=1 Tax=Lepisosteus oculatus TaxID=7918 RepID=UPI0007404668|nr:PREDICTED: FXYD domain-containing ion transport regulator 3-like isoform X2 [Lepisosteus oculatus]
MRIFTVTQPLRRSQALECEVEMSGRGFGRTLWKMEKLSALVLLTVIAVAVAENESPSNEDNEDNPFKFDYYRLRVGGLILSAVLCLIGITILLSGHCRCKFKQDKRRRTGHAGAPARASEC